MGAQRVGNVEHLGLAALSAMQLPGNVAVCCNHTTSHYIACSALRSAYVVTVAHPQGMAAQVMHVRLQHTHIHAAERRKQVATCDAGLRRVELLELVP